MMLEIRQSTPNYLCLDFFYVKELTCKLLKAP